jgi:hypothetical protein
MSALFSAKDIANLRSENDVREVVVRPFLHALGYRQGTDNDIETGKVLRYNRAMLGRMDPARDPVLTGVADYICHARPWGRWVLEAKAPKQLSTADAWQANTYAAHPEVGAFFFLLSNGRDFQLYRIGQADKPLFAWPTIATETEMMRLQNLLAPAAIRKLAYVNIDLGKPLARGFNSAMAIHGGVIVRENGGSDSPLFAAMMTKMDGATIAVTGGSVKRTDDGRIEGLITFSGPFEVFNTMNRAAGFTGMPFSTGDAYISEDVERPTLFHGRVTAELPAGAYNPPIPIFEFKGGPLPFRISFTNEINAAAYITGARLKGIYTILARIKYHDVPAQAAALLPSDVTTWAQGTLDIAVA